MKLNATIIAICLPILGLIGTGCKKKSGTDDLNNVDCKSINSGFTSDIKPLIAGACLASGCHNSGSVYGDFTNYSGIKAKVDNGSFENRVIQKKDMPLNKRFTNEELKKIKCWLNAGAPEN
jgi:hypothetical protein